MREASHEKALIGVGIDVGGSGLRCAAFRPGATRGLLAAVGSLDAEHGRGALADAIATTVANLLSSLGAEHAADKQLVVGVAAPGLKTNDERGIASARYLDASPHLLDELAQALQSYRLPPLQLAPILASDAEAALVGETTHEAGVLHGVESALFLGPGTGLAEARLQHGLPVPVAGPRAAKSPITNDDGTLSDLETECSLTVLNSRWRGRARAEVGRVEDAAASGDSRASALMIRFAEALGRVIALRLRNWNPPARTPIVVHVHAREDSFFRHQSVRELVVPVLRAAAQERGAVLAERAELAPGSQRFTGHIACAGALALGLAQSRPDLRGLSL